MENKQNPSPKAKRAYTPRQKRVGQYKFAKSLQYIRDEANVKHLCLDTIGPYDGFRKFTLYWHNRNEDHWIVKVEMSWAKLLEICGDTQCRKIAKEMLNR